ncbi:hypothetical protein F4815DRAFT_449080 [Daldinia loculata]|nr:hypothetical protein F4815DRAFT_449080 [Daldinia loculata]
MSTFETSVISQDAFTATITTTTTTTVTATATNTLTYINTTAASNAIIEAFWTALSVGTTIAILVMPLLCFLMGRNRGSVAAMAIGWKHGWREGHEEGWRKGKEAGEAMGEVVALRAQVQQHQSPLAAQAQEQEQEQQGRP